MAKNKTEAPPVEGPKGQVIYLGPTFSERIEDAEGVRTFHITKYAIYKNGLPSDVLSRMESDPDFKMLIVPVKKMNTAMVQLRKESPLSEAYARVDAAWKSKGGK